MLWQLYPDSPAAAAGLVRGDIITSCDGAEVKSAQDIMARIASTQPGTQIKLVGLRRGTGGFEATIIVRQRPRIFDMEASVTVRRFADRTQLQSAIEERLQAVLAQTSSDRPVVMLSGGSTPIPAYLNLATRPLKPRRN